MQISNCMRSPKTNEIFYTTEKSNCTQVVSLFFYRCNLIDEAFAYNKWVHDYRWEVYVPSYPTFLHDLSSSSTYKKFKFVRCPYDRAVSCYFRYCVYPLYSNHKPVSNLTIVKRRLPKVLLSDIRYKPPTEHSFLDFLHLMQVKFKTLNRYSTTCPDPHLATQSFQQELTHNIIWDHVIHIEKMKEELEQVGIYDLDQLEHVKKHLEKNHWHKQHSNKKKSFSCPYATVPYQKINIKNVNYTEFYNDECKLLVEKLYKIDFQCHPEYTWKEFLHRNNIV